MRKVIALGTAAASLAGIVALAAPAGATSVTFSLAGGSLSISQPTATATLTGGALAVGGSTVAGALGQTSVTDDRGGVIGWSSKISGTSFTNGTTVIAVGDAKAYVPGAVTVTGAATSNAGTYLTAPTGLALTTADQALVTATAVVGVNTATFTPNLSVAVPGNATAGTYTGTVTQTVG